MLSVKTNPVGVDVSIQRIQQKLYAALGWSNYDCYGRCYRNKKDSGYVAEVFTTGTDYKDVYWNDTLSALSFFGLSDKITNEKGLAKASVHLVVFVNLEKLKPTVTHRADEEVRIEVINALKGCEITGWETSIENVLREYPVSRDALRDMQPMHCFRVNLLLIYDPQQC